MVLDCHRKKCKLKKVKEYDKRTILSPNVLFRKQLHYTSMHQSLLLPTNTTRYKSTENGTKTSNLRVYLWKNILCKGLSDPPVTHV